MKQAELNELLNLVLKQSAKAHKWKCSRGFVFKATELLFFSIGILGQAKQRHLFHSLRYKLLAFDDLFRKIAKLEENLTRARRSNESVLRRAPADSIVGPQP